MFAGTVRDNLHLGRGRTPTTTSSRPPSTGRAPGLGRGAARRARHRGRRAGHALTPAQAQQLALARVLLLDPPSWCSTRPPPRPAPPAPASSRPPPGRDRGPHRPRRRPPPQPGPAPPTASSCYDGPVVEEGTHDDLVAAGGRYADLWHAWSTWPAGLGWRMETSATPTCRPQTPPGAWAAATSTCSAPPGPGVVRGGDLRGARPRPRRGPASAPGSRSSTWPPAPSAPGHRDGDRDPLRRPARRFLVAADDADGTLLATGVVERAVVDRERFLARRAVWETESVYF